MKYTKMKISLVASLLASTSAFAQGQEGHGGNVVACFNNGMDKVISERAKAYAKTGYHQDPIGDDGIQALNGRPQLLDLYELKTSTDLSGRSTDMVASPTTFEQGIQEVLDRTKNTHYLFYRDVLREAQRQLPISQFSLAQSGITEVDDSNTLIRLPQGCLLLQIAVQTTTGSIDSVAIDQRLFSRMDPLHQTALITHEWMINTFMTNAGSYARDQDSNRSRKLNSILYRRDFQPQLAGSSEARIRALLAGFRSSYNNYDVHCSTEDVCNFYYSGQPYQSIALNSSGSGLQQRTAGLASSFANGTGLIEFTALKEVRSYQTRKIRFTDNQISGVYIDFKNNPTAVVPEFFKTYSSFNLLITFENDGSQTICGSNLTYKFLENSNLGVKGHLYGHSPKRCYSTRDSFQSFTLEDANDDLSTSWFDVELMKKDRMIETCKKIKVTGNRFECIKN